MDLAEVKIKYFFLVGSENLLQYLSLGSSWIYCGLQTLA